MQTAKKILLIVAILTSTLNSRAASPINCMNAFYVVSPSVTPRGNARNATKLETENFLPSLQKLDEAVKEVLSRGGKSENYLKRLSEAQQMLILQMKNQGIHLGLIDRHDFKGFPLPAMMKGASKKAIDDYIRMESFKQTLSEGLGQARLAPALQVMPDLNGGVLNQLAFHVLKDFGLKSVVEIGSVDNAGAAASFNSEGPYFSLPISDLFANGISYGTFHELNHMINFFRSEPASTLSLKIAGDGLTQLMKSSLYSSGFTIDELQAYPAGTLFEIQQWSQTQAQEAFVPAMRGNQRALLSVSRQGSRLRYVTDLSKKSIIPQQMVDLNTDFLNPLQVVVQNISLKETTELRVSGFLGESLILIDPDSKMRISLNVSSGTLLGDGKPISNPTLNVDFPDLRINVTLPLDQKIQGQAISFLNTATLVPKVFTDANSAIFALWKQVQEQVQIHLEQKLTRFVKVYTELNQQMTEAIKVGDEAKMQSTLIQMLAAVNLLRTQNNQSLLTAESYLKSKGL
jgi:hypothetical protein